MRRFVPVLLFACSACGEELLDPGRAKLDPGHEPDPWTEAPAATRGLVEKEASDGTRTVVLEAPAPIDSFSLGEGGVGRFVVTGFAEDDTPVVRARSLLLSPAGLASTSLPLFVSRTARFARPPGELITDQGERPAAAVVGGRYLLTAGGQAGDRVALDGYDLGAWRPLAPQPSLGCPSPPCRVSSLAVVADSAALAIGDGWAIWFDLAEGTSGDVALPDGLGSWADVAGGTTIEAPSGEAYVVGGTRSGTASHSVVKLAADGAVTALSLVADRAGAAATWIDGRGLVVVGGGDTVAAGAELLPDGAKAFTTLPYPPDATTGAALLARDGSHLVRLGGRDASGPAPSVELNLACGANCQPSPAFAPVSLDRARAFRLGTDRALVLGDDDGGNVAAVVVDAADSEPRALRDPRRAATFVALPTGHVGVVGGRTPDGSPARTLELYLE